MSKNILKIIYFFCILMLNLFNISCKNNKVDYSKINDTLEKVFYDDQKYRLLIDSILKKEVYETEKIDSLNKLILQTDSINKIIITNILDKYGWPNSKKISKKANLGIWVFIQHSEVDFQIKYLPLLKEAAERGNIDKEYLAYTIDRIEMNQNREQIYGTQIFVDKSTENVYLYPLKDPINVDKRRKEMGLTSLKFYLVKFRINWDPKEYIKQLPEIRKIYEDIVSQYDKNKK